MPPKTFVSPFDINREENAHLLDMDFRRPKSVGPNLTGQEIACVVGGVNDEPIPALFHPASRTVFPVRKV